MTTMNFLGNFTIGKRLGAGFLITIMVAVAMALAARQQMATISQQVGDLTRDEMDKVVQLSHMKDNQNVIARGVRNIVLLSDKAVMQTERKRIEEMRAKNAEIVAGLEATVHSASARELLKAVSQTLPPYEQAIDKAIALGFADDDAAATKSLLADVRPMQNAYFKAVETGELDPLMNLLSENVVLWADGGGKTAAAVLRPISGRETVARVSLGSRRFWPENYSVELKEVNGEAAMIVRDGEQPFCVLAIDVEDGQVQTVRIIANPEKLARV
jgi:hypothetical protein